jgi:hypothetical protein
LHGCLPIKAAFFESPPPALRRCNPGTSPSAACC